MTYQEDVGGRTQILARWMTACFVNPDFFRVLEPGTQLAAAFSMPHSVSGVMHLDRFGTQAISWWEPNRLGINDQTRTIQGNHHRLVITLISPSILCKGNFYIHFYKAILL